MATDSKNLICNSLPTTAHPENGKILVTGAGGYIGGRLIPELLGRGYQVRILVRKNLAEYQERWPGVEIAVGDALNLEALNAALHGIHIAYYLLHSLCLGKKKFESVDLIVANNFRIAAEKSKINRTIYLSGLGNKNANLSPHLKNRHLVAKELAGGPIQVTSLRAGMIIGSGSASYEILKSLVLNIPFFFIPKWAKTKSQPIAIRDVIRYLVGTMELPGTSGMTFDIGGPDILTYEEKLDVMARILGKKRYFFSGPTLNTNFYGYFISLFTPVAAPITKVLLEGCKDEATCRNEDIKLFLPFDTIGFKSALILALSSEEKGRIITRWTDAYPPEHELETKLDELERAPRFTGSFIISTQKTPTSIFKSFCKLNGKDGWLRNNMLWRLRGLIDLIFISVGTARGLSHTPTIKVNDVIDSWRVERIIKNKQLVLRSEMKIPGSAWLKFSIENANGVNKLLVNAYFEPKGVGGRIYWYISLPFHKILFKKLLEQILRRS